MKKYTKTTKASKPKAAKAPKAAKNPAKGKTDAKPKRTGALEAAAKVLPHAAEPTITKQLIDAMAAKGLWSSPGGATP